MHYITNTHWWKSGLHYCWVPFNNILVLSDKFQAGKTCDEKKLGLVKVQKAEVPVYFNFLFLEITNVEGPVLESYKGSRQNVLGC